MSAQATEMTLPGFEPRAQITGEELAESLTGFEELAISKFFGKEEFTELPGTMAGRAMVFIALRREGKPDKDAYDGCMAMTLKQCGAYFAEAEPDAMPEEPDSESGKEGLSFG